jgi:hypothetical protein
MDTMFIPGCLKLLNYRKKKNVTTQKLKFSTLLYWPGFAFKNSVNRKSAPLIEQALANRKSIGT